MNCTNSNPTKPDTMPADTIENPVIPPQSADVIKETMAAHKAAAEMLKTPAEEGEWNPFEKAKEAIVQKEKEAAAPPPKKEEPKAVEAKPITEETTDTEIESQIDPKLPKNVREHLKLTNFAAREAKRAVKAAQAELEAARTELAKTKGQAPDSDATQAVQKELEAARKRIEEQETELAGSRVEKTQMFKKEVGEPLEALEKQFKKFSSEYEVAPEELMGLTNLKGRAQDAKFEEITADWGKRKADRLAELLAQHEGLMDKRSEVLGRAKQTYDSVVAQEREARDLEQARITSERKAVLPDIWEKAVVAAVPTLKDVNGDLGEQIKGIQSFIQQADDQWFAKQPVADRVRLTAQAAALPVVVKHYEGRIADTSAKLAAAEKQIAELTGATPSAGGGIVKKETPVPPEEQGEWKPWERAERR